MITSPVKQIFTQLGIDKGYTVRVGGQKGIKSEFLFDIAWLKEDEENDLVSIELALESELSDLSGGGVRHDFNKLIVTDAKMKFFLCRVNRSKENGSTVEYRKKFLTRYFKAYEGSLKSRIVCLIWDDSGDGKLHVLILEN
jgi:hypothetical protein